MAKISAVTVVAPNLIAVTWETGRSDRIDLTDWIETGGKILMLLADTAVFATARVAEYGYAVAWGDDDDVAIDAHYLRRIARDRSVP